MRGDLLLLFFNYYPHLISIILVWKPHPRRPRLSRAVVFFASVGNTRASERERDEGDGAKPKEPPPLEFAFSPQICLRKRFSDRVYREFRPGKRKKAAPPPTQSEQQS